MLCSGQGADNLRHTTGVAAVTMGRSDSVYVHMHPKAVLKGDHLSLFFHWISNILMPNEILKGELCTKNFCIGWHIVLAFYENFFCFFFLFVLSPVFVSIM